MRAVVVSLVLALAIIAADAGAAVLFKLTDRAGQVTYADIVPRGFDGTVLRIDIEPSAKTVPSERLPEVIRGLTTSPPVTAAVARAASDEERARAARARVDAARLALEDARNNSTAEDWQYFVQQHESGGRRVAKPEYAERLARLEADIEVAEEDLRTLEREIRLR